MKKIGNFLASDYVTLMSTTTGENNNFWWCWTVLYPNVELQYVILQSLLIIFDGFNCSLSDYGGYWHNMLSNTGLPGNLKYVWIYTHTLCEVSWCISSIL